MASEIKTTIQNLELTRRNTPIIESIPTIKNIKKRSIDNVDNVDADSNTLPRCETLLPSAVYVIVAHSDGTRHDSDVNLEKGICVTHLLCKGFTFDPFVYWNKDSVTMPAIFDIYSGREQAVEHTDNLLLSGDDEPGMNSTIGVYLGYGGKVIKIFHFRTTDKYYLSEVVAAIHTYHIEKKYYPKNFRAIVASCFPIPGETPERKVFPGRNPGKYTTILIGSSVDIRFWIPRESRITNSVSGGKSKTKTKKRSRKKPRKSTHHRRRTFRV